MKNLRLSNHCFTGSFPATAVLTIWAVLFSGMTTIARQKDDDFKWEEAAEEVLTLPFPQRFIDSLRKSYKVTLPEKPLRTINHIVPFRGETLVYDIGWGPFKAGYVILTSNYDAAQGTLRIGGKALSNNFVGAFYRMRDFVITHLDATGLYPLFFEQHLREGKKYRSDGWILYDYAQKKIHVKERRLKTLDAPAFVNDYLSVLTVIRTRRFAPGDTFALPLYVDKKIHTMYFLCRERKTLSIESGDVLCLMLEPRLVGDKGNFNKKDKLEVWFTDDSLKRPVLIKSKIKVGSITARLINHTAGKAKKAPEAKQPAPDTLPALDTVQAGTAQDTLSDTADSTAAGLEPQPVETGTAIAPGDSSGTPSDTAASSSQ
jgi:hypothetical protein